VRDHERWLLHARDHVYHSECFARACDPEERLEPTPALDPFRQGCDGLRLVAAWMHLGDEVKPLAVRSVAPRPSHVAMISRILRHC
jgi:hypothetical protein